MNTIIISDNIRTYVPYFKWNEAFVDYFFNSHKKGEILLYVDESILEKVGNSIGITHQTADEYKNDFQGIVVEFCKTFYGTKNILHVASQMKDDGRFYAMNQERRIERDVLTGNPKIYDLPYLNIIIYILLTLDNGKTQQWANVHRALNLESISHDAIQTLWPAIHEFTTTHELNGQFDENASVLDQENRQNQDHIGRLKYHLPLPSSTRNRINAAIYKTGVWKVLESLSLSEIISRILRSFRDEENDPHYRTINNIMLGTFSNNDASGVSLRKLESVIENFDIEEYKQGIENERQNRDYSRTLISGEFALGIHFPADNAQEDNSIVLLTTVQQQLEGNGFLISEGGSGTFAGYNTEFVRVNNTASVNLQEYSLTIRNNCRITPLPLNDVIFFYEYDEHLYIQTRYIRPSHSYFVAVRRGVEEQFEAWCTENQNVLDKLAHDDTSDFFGDGWIIYYTTNVLNGQYYTIEDTARSDYDVSTVIMKGGIKKSTDTYFINALPYLEVPAKYNCEDLNIYVNLNGAIFEDYTKHIIDNKIILDVPQMPIDSDEIAYMDIGVECDKEAIATYSINVCGQSIDYNKEFLYKYNRFGIKDDAEYSYSANDIDEHYMSNRVWGHFSLTKDDFTEISEEFYFTNLLAACCFAHESSEITHDRLRKCISYAATRLNIDIQREGFIKNAKNALNKAGLLQIDYTSNKCQAIPPSFMKVPYSVYQSDGTQLIMLSGCYTRAFLADLRDYCEQKNVKIYSIKNESDKDEERLIPPVILLGHNFNPNDFCDQYGHTCNVVLDHDFALSLLNVMPSYDAINSKFEFVHNDSDIFLSSLEASKSVCMPRLRSMRTVANLKQWYIEKSNNYFAVIPQGHMAWASMYCLHEQGSSMIVYSEKEKSAYAYISNSLILPNYVYRALYMMNLGLPEQRKVFMCDNPDSNYYSIMSYYHLNSNERREVLVSKLTGNEAGIARQCVNPRGFEMEFWKSKMNGRKQSKRYLVLYNDNNVLAIATDGKVYLNCLGVYHRIKSEDSINKILSFLIKEGWNYLYNRTAIGYSRKGGNEITKVYDISPTELIELPEKEKFNIDKIEII